MSVRKEVRELVALGSMPDSDTAQVEQVQRFQDAIERISPPVTHEEAEALLTVFGPDECFGLAWAVLHLIETTPGGIPIEKRPAATENEWIRFLWDRSHRQ
jgi:hypothetical protein